MLRCAIIWLGFTLLTQSGCATPNFASMRTIPINPLANALSLESKKGPQVSDRTKTLLRHYDLLTLYEKQPNACLEQLTDLSLSEKGAEKIYAVAELAYVLGVRAQRDKKPEVALDLLSIAVGNSYMYLFCPELDVTRNPYDPQFRAACDVYNGSLELTLRLVNKSVDGLRPGMTYTIESATKTQDVPVVSVGPWHAEDFDKIDFCSDWNVEGLSTSNINYGIGVPLIAVRKKHEAEDPAESNYPEGLSFPVTAILRVSNPTLQAHDRSKFRYPCVLELHDPLFSSEVFMAARRVPLQTDLSTPLAYFLDNPKFREQTAETLGLINPAKTAEQRGIYMLEPFDPKRIPVLMVHGLWSSPLTWMPMFNDLRNFPELRRNYQFWFYQYPTGQPFWVSATQLRQELVDLRKRIDPQHQSPMLDRMVLVGHSMGGLVSRMQTFESENAFWEAIGNRPFEEIRGSRDEVEQLAAVLFFHPNQSIRRVITIGTPHRGSDFANDTTRWISRKVIKLPQSITNLGNSLVRQNPDLFHDTNLLTVNTSIDSLSPESPIFPAMLRAKRADWVTYHNIYGLVPQDGIINRLSKGSDGIVSIESAHADDAVSEIDVESRHQDIHRTPKAILEVRRILKEHLEETYTEHQLAEGMNQRLFGDVRKLPTVIPASAVKSAR
jgi:pimeloyl-ACP methyl ester carboxylesterase